MKDLVESSAVKKNLYLKKACVSASVPEVITRINTPSVMRLRNIGFIIFFVPAGLKFRRGRRVQYGSIVGLAHRF